MLYLKLHVISLEVIKTSVRMGEERLIWGSVKHFIQTERQACLETLAASQTIHQGRQTLRKKCEFGKKLRKLSPPGFITLLQPNHCVPNSPSLSPVLMLSPISLSAPDQRMQKHMLKILWLGCVMKERIEIPLLLATSISESSRH